jgi:methionine sulfoxide reductase heme-binding subunit
VLAVARLGGVVLLIAATLSHSKMLWYLMRASGLVALLLLTLALVAGIVNVKRFATPRWPRAVTALLHRNVALLAVVFLSLHVATAALDSYVAVGWLATVIPFSSEWDRLWVGFGTAAVDLMGAVVLTSLLRARLTYRVWKAVHWLAYATWPLAIVHGWAAGTDSGATWAQAVYALSLLSVMAAVAWRVRRPMPVTAGSALPGDRVPTTPATPVPASVGGSG